MASYVSLQTETDKDRRIHLDWINLQEHSLDFNSTFCNIRHLETLIGLRWHFDSTHLAAVHAVRKNISQVPQQAECYQIVADEHTSRVSHSPSREICPVTASLKSKLGIQEMRICIIQATSS